MFDEKSYSLKMDKTIEVFSKELSSLRTGRANASMLDLIKVDVYGQQMPINQVGSITTPEPRMINIQIWDANNVPLVDAAIKKSDLGLNPQIDGQLIRLPVPELNEERRTELKKLIKSIGEKCKVSIRNIRREANEDLKKLLKSKEISEDEEKNYEKKVQAITDEHITSVDEKVSLKEKEINFLFNLLENFLLNKIDELNKQNIKLKIIGLKNFSSKLNKLLIKSENKTKKNNRLQINLALNYGSKNELLNAFKSLRKFKKKITEKNFVKYLQTSNIPDPDILIRTGNTQRLSNFLLWQIAYTEIFFEKKLWPDFNKNDYRKIINKFKSIKRNYGKIWIQKI